MAPVVLERAPAIRPTSTQKAAIPKPSQKTSGMSAGDIISRNTVDVTVGRTGAGAALARALPAAAGRRAARFGVVRILAFSDLHRDLDQAASLVEMSGEADVVIGAGDFASIHEG